MTTLSQDDNDENVEEEVKDAPHSPETLNRRTPSQRPAARLATVRMAAMVRSLRRRR